MQPEDIQSITRSIHQELISIRRHLHQHPELSFEEKETGKYISAKLEEWGIDHQHGIAENGVVAMVIGKNPGKKVVALRGDIDALPILEANDVPYKSKNEGVMHACGHDVHTTSLLGAIKILHATSNHWEGSVKCLFQPGEERLPGGASIMIKEGALKNPSPTAIFGQHVHPPLQVGKVGMRPGKYMASADEIYVTVKGRGGHGALPQDCVDPILLASNILMSLQQVVSRYSNPTTPSVLTFGKIYSVGGSTNVIPNEVKMEGTFRTMDEDWRRDAHKRMKKIAESIAQGMGGACDFDIKKGYPFLINDEVLTKKAWDFAVEYLGEENVVELPIRMTAEDFAYYSQVMPSCFYRLGTGNPAKGITSPIHTNTFDIDEDALLVGAGLLAWMAIRELAAI